MTTKQAYDLGVQLAFATNGLQKLATRIIQGPRTVQHVAPSDKTTGPAPLDPSRSVATAPGSGMPSSPGVSQNIPSAAPRPTPAI